MKKICIKDENGERIIQQIPAKRREWNIEINTLEELMDLVKNEKDEIIVNWYEGENPYLEIYDNYRE